MIYTPFCTPFCFDQGLIMKGPQNLV